MNMYSRLLNQILALCLVTISVHCVASEGISIKLANQTGEERQTESQLKRILRQYDLEAWTFTRSIVIDENEIPHSHPILTLHTRHIRDDELLLSTYIHEQLHWFVAQHPREANEVIQELKHLYPDVPVGFPVGSSDADGNYEHLIVVYLEYRADQRILGELRARSVMDFWAADHYTWIYKEVLNHPQKIGKVLKEHGLIPG